jgi:hypothetical protein
MPKEHKKTHNVALVGTAAVTIVIILLWVRVLLPMERQKNVADGSSTADLIKSITPEVPKRQEVPETDSITNQPLLDESSYQQ